jgi:hypothetical protein
MCGDGRVRVPDGRCGRGDCLRRADYRDYRELKGAEGRTRLTYESSKP